MAHSSSEFVKSPNPLGFFPESTAAKLGVFTLMMGLGIPLFLHADAVDKIAIGLGESAIALLLAFGKQPQSRRQ